ncbi:hypothetical protein Forpi1262_v006056 [Fusarium oxysporum f. sp. raphani]|uniref:Uncharacterized protein n=1 Tax=Fusarium oxysporum f. sp. raphani TaxID=96318 RepID=A0A8J5Q6K1_FUSOX|nr:hypothetical protein Forpi1262_v006056 [Fusarium oxysporum f. sp. raphani]
MEGVVGVSHAVGLAHCRLERLLVRRGVEAIARKKKTLEEYHWKGQICHYEVSGFAGNRRSSWIVLLQELNETTGVDLIIHRSFL